MTPTPTHSPFHSARLVRVLADMGLADAQPPGPARAQRLAQWVDIKQAIALRAAQDLPSGVPTAADPGLVPAFEAVQRTVEQAIAEHPAHPDHPAHHPVVAPASTASTPPVPYAPYRRYHLALQRQMERTLRPVRLRVRAALAGASPSLQQLAALDAAWEDTLQVRESRLLAGLQPLLEQRFQQLRAAHLASAPAANGSWLARFVQELQQVLRAEWELRQQPTLGLLEALHNDMPHTL